VFVFIVAILVGFGVGVLWVQILDVARNRVNEMSITIIFASK
jgi:hypothetical protein